MYDYVCIFDRSILCIGYASGTLCTYDYETRRLKVEKTITSGPDEYNAITSIAYSHQGIHTSGYFSQYAILQIIVGLHLVCGTSGGYLWFLHPATLEPQQAKPFFFTHSEIQRIRFSADNNYLVYHVCIVLLNIILSVAKFVVNIINKYSIVVRRNCIEMYMTVGHSFGCMPVKTTTVQ